MGKHPALDLWAYGRPQVPRSQALHYSLAIRPAGLGQHPLSHYNIAGLCNEQSRSARRRRDMHSLLFCLQSTSASYFAWFNSLNGLAATSAKRSKPMLFERLSNLSSQVSHQRSSRGLGWNTLGATVIRTLAHVIRKVGTYSMIAVSVRREYKTDVSNQPLPNI